MRQHGTVSERVRQCGTGSERVRQWDKFRVGETVWDRFREGGRVRQCDRIAQSVTGWSDQDWGGGGSLQTTQDIPVVESNHSVRRVRTSASVTAPHKLTAE